MKWIGLSLSVGLLAIWITALTISHKGPNGSLPPLGSLLSPTEGFMQQAESMTEGKLLNSIHSGITNPVQVQFDERLVPHIFADNIKDAYATLGYIHAKYRLFQMDLVSRSAEGRLAELLGERLVERDQLQRRKGLAWAAKKAVESWEQSSSYEVMEAYSEGYNSYLKQLKKRDLPLEFKLLNYQPEPWTPYRSALLLKSMAQTLCARNYDFAATNALNIIGEKRYRELFPDQMSNEDPIVPESVEYPFNPLLPSRANKAVNINELIGHIPLENPPENVGSNNWAVSGKKTKNGFPILANDPHLSLTLPSIWYEAHLITPETNVYGVSLAGYPGIIIGFNENIAWGMTNVGQDVTDWYRINWANDDKTAYWLDSAKQEVTLRIEEIKVKGGTSTFDTIKHTVWGPIVFDESDLDSSALAMHWLPHYAPKPSEIESFKQVNQARNFDEFSNAAQNFETPPQNIVFASNTGDIGIRIQGKFPLKTKGQGKFIHEGDNSDHGWKGFIPMAHNPAMLNPERQFVSSANQKSTDKNYPYNYHGRFEEFRGRILNRKLAKMEAIDVDDMRNLQTNNYSLKAEEFVPLLLRHLNTSTLKDSENEIIKDLKNWDFNYVMESKAATFFELWLDATRKITWDELKTSDDKTVLKPQDWVLRDILENQPNHDFLDIQSTPEKESAAELVTEAFGMAVKEYVELKENNKQQWVDYNNPSIPHLALIPAFGKNKLSINGTASALNAQRGSFGPSWRMVVELGPKVQGHGVYPGGQSGNPGSPYYDTGIQKWSDGELYKLNFIKQPNELKRAAIIHQFTNQ